MVARAAGGLQGLTFQHVAALLALAAAKKPGHLDWPHGVTVDLTARAVTVRRQAGLRA